MSLRNRADFASQVRSFANCTSTLGQLLKFGFQCQLDTEIIFQVIQAASHNEDLVNNRLKNSYELSNLHVWVTEKLLSEMLRLLYWLCRGSQESVDDLFQQASPDKTMQEAVRILTEYWRKHCIPSLELVQNYCAWASGARDVKISKRQKEALEQEGVEGETDLEMRKEVICNMNILFWILIPTWEARWLLKKNQLEKLDLVFELLYVEPPPVVSIEYEVEVPVDSQPRSSMKSSNKESEEDGPAAPQKVIRVKKVKDWLGIFNTALCNRTLQTAKFVLDRRESSEALARRLGERLLHMLFYVLDVHTEKNGEVDDEEDDETNPSMPMTPSSSRNPMTPRAPGSARRRRSNAVRQSLRTGSIGLSQFGDQSMAASMATDGFSSMSPRKTPRDPDGKIIKRGLGENEQALLPLGVLVDLVEGVSLAAMRRDVCSSFAAQDIFSKLVLLSELLQDEPYASDKRTSRIELGILRLSGVLGCHPGHRLPWAISSEHVGGLGNFYPNRQILGLLLDGLSMTDKIVALRRGRSQDSGADVFASHMDTIMGLLRSCIVKHDVVFCQFKPDIWDTLFAVIRWWRDNSSMQYREEKAICDKVCQNAETFGGDGEGDEGDIAAQIERKTHVEILDDFMNERDDKTDFSAHGVRQTLDAKLKKITKYTSQNLYIAPTRAGAPAETIAYPPIQDSLRYTSVYESLLILNVLSRLALESRYKRLLFGKRHPNVPSDMHSEGILRCLLCCIAHGCWPEARDAASVLANLMWHGDARNERLLCWLKFDSPCSTAVDASNVLMPIAVGQPKRIDLGKGMYRRSWGCEFVELSLILLHPDGLNTGKVPGIMTVASPGDTFENANSSYRSMLEQDIQAQRHFTIHCW